MPISRDVRRARSIRPGSITGLEGISTERTLELIPSLTLSETGRRVRVYLSAARAAGAQRIGVPIDPGRFVNQPVGLDPGLTAKFGITPTITLDLAINPDFAQVEADQPSSPPTSASPSSSRRSAPSSSKASRFSSTPLTAVHTRAIVDPDVAAKLTGKRGRNTFGLLVASDNAPGNLSDDDRDFIRATEDRSGVSDPTRAVTSKTGAAR